MKILLLLLDIASSSFSDSVLLASSSKTPESLLTFFSKVNHLNLSSNPDMTSLSNFQTPSVILDISLDITFFPKLDLISKYFQVPYLTLTKTQSIEHSSYRFSTIAPVEQEAEALLKLLKYLGWRSLTIFVSNSQQNLELLTSLKKKLTEFQIKSFAYNSEITEEFLDTFIKRFLKTTAVKHLLVIDQGQSLELLIRLLKKRKMNQFGNYFLFTVSSIYSIDLEGSLILSTEAGQDSKSIEEFYFGVLESVSRQVSPFHLEKLRVLCPGSFCFGKFWVFNQQDGRKVRVGQVEEDVVIDTEMIFPGKNKLSKILIFKTKLPVMIANGTAELNGMPDNLLTTTYFYGARYAQELINSNNYLENFEIQLVSTNCGNIYFNLTESIPCFAGYASGPGLAYISAFYVGGALGNLISLKYYKMFLPQVSPHGLSDTLNNSTLYPEFIKLSGSMIVFIQNMLTILNFFKWHEFLFISSDDSGSKILMQQSLIIFNQMGLKLINSEEYRLIPFNYNRKDFEKYRNFFEYLRDTRCRVIFMIYSNPGMVLEAFYDVGLRKGDIIIISNFNAYSSMLEDIEEEFMSKRKEILNGALLSTLPEYEGELGKDVERELKKRYSNVINMCLTFDAFLTISNSLRYILEKGEDYEEPHILMQTMRTQRFVGCSGDVYFIPNQNNRNRDETRISQLLINSSTKSVDIFPMASLNRFAIIASKIINPPVWMTGEDNVPKIYRTDAKCVYDKKIQKSKYGIFQIHIVSSFYFLVTLAISCVLKRKFDHPLKPMPRKSYATLYDHLSMLFLALELFQILALHPRSSIYAKALKSFAYIPGFNIISAYNLKFEEFWRFYKFLLGGSLNFSVFSVIVLVSERYYLKLFHFMGILEFWSNYILPILGHFMLMPVFLGLFQIFRCEEGLSDDLLESFFFRDCSQYCYKGKHYGYSIFSAMTLILFLFCSIYYRHRWEDSRVYFNIHTKASFLSVLSVFQVVLVLVKVNVEIYSEFIMGCCISFLLLVMILATIYIKPYNYERVHITQIFALSLALWTFLINIVSVFFYRDRLFSIILFSGCGFLILIWMMIVSRSPNRFIVDRENAIPVLMRFQFSKRFGEIITRSKYYQVFHEIARPGETTREIKF